MRHNTIILLKFDVSHGPMVSVTAVQSRSPMPENSRGLGKGLACAGGKFLELLKGDGRARCLAWLIHARESCGRYHWRGASRLGEDGVGIHDATVKL